MRNPKFSKGFSLIEVMIAVVVVAIGLLGTLAALTYGLKSSEHAERMTVATSHARHMMGLIRSQGLAANNAVWGKLDPNLTDADTVRRELNDPPFDGAGEMPAGTNMRRNILITQGLGGTMDDVAEIRIRVFWTLQGHEKSVEIMGLQRKES